MASAQNVPACMQKSNLSLRRITRRSVVRAFPLQLLLARRRTMGKKRFNYPVGPSFAARLTRLVFPSRVFAFPRKITIASDRRSSAALSRRHPRCAHVITRSTAIIVARCYARFIGRYVASNRDRSKTREGENGEIRGEGDNASALSCAVSRPGVIILP